MGDVGERATVDQCGATLEGLDQVRQQRILQKERHRAVGLEVSGCDRFLVACQTDDNIAETLLEIGTTGREGDDRHHLAAGDDHEVILPGGPAAHPAEAHHNVPQRAIIHVDGPRPADAALVEAQGVAVMDMAVEHGGEQVVRRGNGVEIPREMKVDLLHGDDLRVAASGCPALDAEDRPEGWLPQRDDDLLAQLAKGLSDADGAGGFTLTGWCRADTGHEHQPALGLTSPERFGRDLGFGVSVEKDVVQAQAQLGGHVLDRPECRGLGDFDIGGH